MKKIIAFALLALVSLGTSSVVYSHCQIPCGIYGDELRFKQVREDITTIEKSMKKIKELSEKDGGAQEANQLVRWVDNKEEHANKIMEVMKQYFLAQRIKIKGSDSKGFDTYQAQLTLIHHMIVYSMKCKQTVDVKYVKKLRKTWDAFEKIYLKPLQKNHHHDKKDKGK